MCVWVLVAVAAAGSNPDVAPAAEEAKAADDEEESEAAISGNLALIPRAKIVKQRNI